MRCFPVACIAILLAGKLQSFANIECASLPLQCAFGFQPVLNDLVGFRAAVTARRQERGLITFVCRQREPGAGGGGDTIFALDDAFAKDRDRAADIGGIGVIRDKTNALRMEDRRVGKGCGGTVSSRWETSY